MIEYCSIDRARDDANSGKSNSLCWNEAMPTYKASYQQALNKCQRYKRAALVDVQESQAKDAKKNGDIPNELQQLDTQQAAH